MNLSLFISLVVAPVKGPILRALYFTISMTSLMPFTSECALNVHLTPIYALDPLIPSECALDTCSYVPS